MSDDFFSNRVSVQQVEESNELAPKFDNEGLIPVITMDSKTSDILMLGYQNAEALSLSIKTGFAHYWSRSRKCLWKKGDTSGLYQRIDEIFIDDDQDAVLMKVIVDGTGASCHVGYKSCFYRKINHDKNKNTTSLKFVEKSKTFDPNEIYGDMPNPTKL